jgi:hypothetical protein
MSNRPDIVQFWMKDKSILMIESSIVPPAGSGICIEGVVYKVESVSYCVDQAGTFMKEQMRANVELCKTKTKPQR